MKKMVNAETAFAMTYALFQKHQWLLGTGKLKPLDQSAENEAVRFLLAASKGKVNGWGKLNKEAQNVVSGLLLDFLAKLKLPNSPYASSIWEVSADAEEWQQALEIIAFEIRKAHPNIEGIH
ncbi:hypothetical protein H2Y56_14540 [Pectobacterium aroidearum]|uniref:Uncharacterized protein n=1 Tax=Pectobacterium aroidearum TaxID=1201031 RepID=A0ABR5ZFG0_9GAMM|nr:MULTISPECIES: hypothetical protein [Pectobacterium]KHS86776.1 hypothetical protein RC83_13700 [Pectobacterium brasiliense]MBA5200525.1 hypothetical protein [Pectobacterium aroidearum]MBA5233317.1 hypothetical protein [Pectobacterium aroidearum]